MDWGRHDPDLGLAGRDDARAVRSDQPHRPALDGVLDFHHVEHRNALRDRHDQADTGIGRLHDGIGSKSWRHEDQTAVRTGFLHGFEHGVENRDAVHVLAGLAWSDPRDNLGAVGHALPGVELALFTGDALHNDPRVFIYEDAHVLLLISRSPPPSSPHL